jgi:hypothetical protein
MASKKNDRFSGFFIATLGMLLTVWNWQLAISNGRFYPKIAIMGPVLIVAGLGILFFPNRLTTKNINRQININGSKSHDVSPTPLGVGVVITAFGSGFLNLAILEGWHL